MRRRWSVSVMTLAVLAGCQTAPAPVGPTFHTQAVDGADGIIVRFQASHDRAVVDTGVPGLIHRRSLLLSHTHLYHAGRGVDEAGLLERLRRHPRVVYAEPNYTVHAYGTTADPDFARLWGHARIQAPQAWDVVTGQAGILVADVDSGVDYTHPDLAAGQIVKGPDLVNQDDDPMDDNGHGTHVAGTIGATANNGVGLVGVAYGTRILAVKVLGAAGSGTYANVADGVIRSQQLGARVINLSLGGPFSSMTLQLAVDQVTQAGSLVVAAAGNDGVKRLSYPAGYPNAMAVGATDSTDAKAAFSNYGDWVDIAAPGVGIYSSTGGGYATWSGTSMSTPHVTGAAALLLAQHPELTLSQLRTALVKHVDPATGFRTTNGMGRLNVLKALNSLIPAPEPTPTPTPAPSPTPKPGKGHR